MASAPSSHETMHTVARYASIVGHPFALIPASVGCVAFLRGGNPRVAGLLGLAFVALSAMTLWGMRVGWFNDFDVSQQARRPRFYLITIALSLGLACLLRHDPMGLRSALTAAGLLCVGGVVNRWIKASLHVALALYAAGFWATWSWAAGLAALPLVGIVAWSRIRLGRHSAREVIAGAAIGLLSAAVIYTSPS